MFKLDVEKAEEPEVKLPTSVGSSKKQEKSRKTSTSALLTRPKLLSVVLEKTHDSPLDKKEIKPVNPKALDCAVHNKLWKILQEMGIPDHLTCLLRNLYAGQETTVRMGHVTTDWFQIGKGVRQGCIMSLCLFNLYSEYIMRNAGLDKAQAGIQIARRNINNFRYTAIPPLWQKVQRN